MCHPSRCSPTYAFGLRIEKTISIFLYSKFVQRTLRIFLYSKLTFKASKRQKIKRESYEADSFLFAEAVVTYGECGIRAELTEDFRLRFAVLKSLNSVLKTPN